MQYEEDENEQREKKLRWKITKPFLIGFSVRLLNGEEWQKLHT